MSDDYSSCMEHHAQNVPTPELFRGNCQLGLGGYGDGEGGVSRLLITIIVIIKITIIYNIYIYFAIISGSGRLRNMVRK